MEGWTKIYSSNQPVQVEIAKSILSENNIDSVEISKKDSSYMFGEIELYVPAGSEIIARLIINQHDL
jgi:Putative prokaryotic signal transducing protein